MAGAPLSNSRAAEAAVEGLAAHRASTDRFAANGLPMMESIRAPVCRPMRGWVASFGGERINAAMEGTGEMGSWGEHRDSNRWSLSRTYRLIFSGRRKAQIDQMGAMRLTGIPRY